MVVQGRWSKVGPRDSALRGRGRKRAAAIVPAELVERYEAMIDLEDGRIAQERLADLDAGRSPTSAWLAESYGPSTR